MRDCKKKATTGRLWQGRKRHRQALFSVLIVAHMAITINGGDYD